MSITYLKIPEGSPLPEKGVRAEDIGQLIITYGKQIQLLAPGDYDVTPEIWTNHNHLHKLAVLESGEGVYSIVPRFVNSGYMESTDAGLTAFHQGGLTSEVNSRSPNYMVIGGHPRKRGYHIFGIIQYLSIM